MPVVVCRDGEKIIVDEQDYKMANAYEWFASYSKMGFLRLRTTEYFNKKRLNFNHVVIGISADQKIIHKNGNYYDFTRDNIIICDKSVYSHYVNKGSGQLYRYNGVDFCEVSKRWFVVVVKDKKRIHSAMFELEEEAAVIADYFSLIYFGQVGKQNFPDLTPDQIKTLADDIHQKYGYMVVDRMSRGAQGRTAKNKTFTSQYVGVYWQKQVQKWEAKIIKMKQGYMLGRFENEKDAAIVYDMKALELYGEHAKLNFPELEKDKIQTLYEEIIKRKREPYSKFKGITMEKKSKRWIAQTTISKKNVCIGRFDTEEEAAKAYEEKMRELGRL